MPPMQAEAKVSRLQEMKVNKTESYFKIWAGFGRNLQDGTFSFRNTKCNRFFC